MTTVGAVRTPRARLTAGIAYFSMEIAVSDSVPTYSGGLGVLAGDHLRASADLGLPIVGVTLVYHDGFFRQTLADDGRQEEHPVRWAPAEQLERLDERVVISLGGRQVAIGAWWTEIAGVDGYRVPVYFLDTRLPGNDLADQSITDKLYTGDPTARLSQEAVLGFGGVAMLGVLGHDIATYHLNEGHASLVPVALLARFLGTKTSNATPADVNVVRADCVFTTHTPVPAGHDRFKRDDVGKVLGSNVTKALDRLGCFERGELNMTTLGMFFAGFINGVAKRHGEVSQAMFPRYRVRSVTNGVHVATWAAPSTRRLFDRHIPRWRQDNTLVRYMLSVPLEEIRSAHQEAKDQLLDEVARRSGLKLKPDILTVGVARRAAAYKRNDLLLSDPERLRRLVRDVGPLQVLYSGKAHPLDAMGKEVIARVADGARRLKNVVSILYLEDYDMALAAQLCAGVDLWLNTPVAPHEASGTSGMKAAINGVPSLSVLDGWWVEGHVEGVTGWAIGADRGGGAALVDGDPRIDALDAEAMYRVLHDVVGPLYYVDPDGFTAVRRGAMALNGSFFTTERMVSEYVAVAYSHDASAARST
ncbi:MAG TPA: alpha-glucan family phosphorylase [Acidimicrobiales bacterium]|nr:alpha-glucan family phosphorylase [Acidimicrobiales bacterium]HXZ62822.1 alpha-glucan family phosphorylase [Acidimicrobiales bacterium]